MDKMTKDQLLDNLASYGYPLLMPASNKPEELLENLLEQDDVRLLEGFPVVFTNMLKEKEELKWEKVDWQPNLLSRKAQTRLPFLLALTVLLFQFNKVEKKYEERTEKVLFKFHNGKEVLTYAAVPFAKSEPVKFDEFEFSPERLENTFKTYVLEASSKNKDLEDRRHDLELELLLSEIFTPRQKTLLRKKMEGESLTKTEREYFSRVVKKRLKVLANDELHQLAHRLLHQ
ncbi:MAG: hypothetical protein HYZ84_07390 [Candidatus Omnitrophica bacterium]|nr:hypothetical protein [Candidatus Omnitrophota bacterium]